MKRLEIENVKKIIKEMKLILVERNGYKNYVVRTTLKDGRVLDTRVKNYEFSKIVETAGIDSFVVTFEHRVNKENVVYDAIIISLPEIEYETFTFYSMEDMAIMALLINKK